jgi:hypothetical protein
MNTRTTTLYILFGVLLIIAAPILLVSQLVQIASSHSDSYYTETTAFVTETVHEQDGKYVMQIAFLDSSWSSENDEVSVPEPDEDVERSSDSVSGGKSMSDSVSAMNRFRLVESDPTTREGMHVAELEMDKKDVSHYKQGDSLRIVYEPGIASTAKIRSAKGTSKNDVNSWLLLSALLFILGIFMVRIGRRNRKEQAQQDILSHYTTSDFLNKKRGPDKGTRPGV